MHDKTINLLMTKKLSWILLLVLSALGTAAFAAEREARWEAMARRAAEESIALLKNEGATLPLAEGATVSLCGAEKLLVCGGGSSAVSSPRTPSMEESLAAAGLSLVGRGAAADAGIVLVSRYSSESKDHPSESYELKAEELAAVAEAKAKCKKVVVVVNAGHLVNLKPLKDNPGVGAILFVWFPGMDGSHAIADIIAGKVNPSGRLAATIAERITDYPSDKYFRAEKLRVEYGEGMDVGYRYFNKKAPDRIVYPFGWGLSYTTFKVDFISRRDAESQSDSQNLCGSAALRETITVRVTNTGDRAGKYSVLHDEDGVLAAFAKTRLLAPGESETLELKPWRREGAVAMNRDPPADPEIEATLKTFSIEEKVALCSAQPPVTPRGTGGIGNLQSRGYPNAQTSDGPNGIRRNGEATCHPVEALLAQSFDEALLEEIGRALGEEAVKWNVDIVLGPGLNIHRHPLCGRNFEYFSEDPLVAGKLGAAFVRGIQSTGVAATLKHFALNNREWKRKDYSSDIADEAALREIYLRPFEIAVREGKARCVMTAYNKINGTYAGECGWLVDGILRGEWGFDGIVMTDWRAKSEIYAQIAAGTDVNMPYGYHDKVARAVEKVKSGELAESKVDDCARRVLREVKRCNSFKEGRFAPVVKIGEEDETALKASDTASISSTWTWSEEDPVEGWCHSDLSIDPGGFDTFVSWEVDVKEAGEYEVFFRAKTEVPECRVSFDAQGCETPALSFASANCWETLGPVRVNLKAGRGAVKVWVRGAKKKGRGVVLSKAILRKAALPQAGNPISALVGHPIDDPHLIEWNGRLYMFACHDYSPKSRNFDLRDWWVWSSEDLLHWRLESVLKPEDAYLKRPFKSCWATGGVLLGRLSVQGFQCGERLRASAHGAVPQQEEPAALPAEIRGHILR